MEEKLQSHKSLVCSFLDCKATFSKSWRLEAHLCKHTGLKPFTCSQCDKSFSARYRLSRHQRNHSGEKPHKCLADGCSKGFGTYTSMKNHMARVHQHKDRLYRCKGCGNDFSKRNQLKAHLGEHLILAFPCTVSGCTRQFLSLRKLKHHEKVHEGYPCENEACTLQGKTWTEYLKHRKEHKVKVLKEVHCGECNKVFNKAYFKEQHAKRVHCQHKWMLVCLGCGKTFTHGFNLDSHVLGEHQGKKPFSCSHAGCGKSFTMKMLTGLIFIRKACGDMEWCMTQQRES
ncbi:general transcription factor IIIA, b isoform X2 [Trematomus bernacchii]|uniref:general transcription factor IIIA, b isoform X2 n=1 Tax=Trematomus bernacchii TaxID=40690 RepID=UPI00146C677B|nr:general transcription factor IIIA, b isoform X2 [Trematomus bernacchii]